MPKPQITKINNFFVKTIGTITYLITLYDIIYFYTFFTQISNRTLEHRSQHLFKTLLVTNAIALPISFILLAVYLRHIAKNEQLDGTNKVMWVLLLLFLPPFSMLVYWHKQLWTPFASANAHRKF